MSYDDSSEDHEDTVTKLSLITNYHPFLLVYTELVSVVSLVDRCTLG